MAGAVAAKQMEIAHAISIAAGSLVRGTVTCKLARLVWGGVEMAGDPAMQAMTWLQTERPAPAALVL